MKIIPILLIAGSFLSPMITRGAETAHARMYCVSLNFQEAVASDSYGFKWTLDLTTIPPTVNGELAPGFITSSFTHSAYVEIDSELAGSEQGNFGLDVPNAGTDAEGFPAFFDVAQGVANLTSSGAIQSPNFYPGNGTGFTATWNRAAGSPDGTCSFQVYDPDNPFNNIQFTFPFTVLEYTGPLTYTPGSNSVAAAVDLTQTGYPANTLQGPIAFVKSATDRFNTLTNQPGVWTNAALQTLSFTNGVFSRDSTFPTNYYGYLRFADGDPATAGADYAWWMLSIDDTNDANGNGIPDFSDDPAVVTPPAPPALSLSLGSTNLFLSIAGDTGADCEIQESASLAPADWQTVLSVTLTNNPQAVSLPLPSGPTSFWRALVK